jgi:UDP-glucuronate 4-epimerase
MRINAVVQKAASLRVSFKNRDIGDAAILNDRCILVTGAAGFIGSNLVDRLLENGYAVIGLDNLSDYYNPEQKLRNLEDATNNESFHLIRGDIRDAKLISNLLHKEEVSLIVHLAAMVGVRNSIDNPELYTDVNVTGTTTLLESAIENDIGRVVLASSSSVYGERKDVPFKESDSTDEPVSIYAATKKSVEAISYAYSQVHELSATCLRFFTVYGPRCRPDMAAYKFIDRIHKGLPIHQYGDGTSFRDYTYIDDITHGIIQSMGLSSKYEIINLGNSKPWKLKDFISVIEDVVGKKAEIEKLPEQPGDVPGTLAETSKAKKLLGYDPKTGLRQGIKKTYAWYLEKGERGCVDK